MREIKKIIIHCSASDNPDHDNTYIIDQWHRARGWSEIGYHFYIDKQGIAWEGRDLEKIGAHCKGHNTDSIGICLGGEIQFTAAQFIKLKALCTRIVKKYNLKWWDIYPHNYFNKNKTCPNFDLADVLAIYHAPRDYRLPNDDEDVHD